MGTPPNSINSGAAKPCPELVRVLVLLVGVAVSAAAVGYVTALAVMILAIVLDAAPLLAALGHSDGCGCGRARIRLAPE